MYRNIPRRQPARLFHDRDANRQQSLWIISLLFLALWLLLANPSTAAPASEDFSSGTLSFTGEHSRIAAPRVHTAVRMQISAVIAQVEVRQQFTNPSDAWVEGLYAFPLPENSAVTKLHMQVGERIIVGEVREKADAQKLYEKARDNGQRASVVHQQRPNIFRTAVANIGPRESIVITLTYQQIVDQDDGQFSVRFPLTITPRYAPGVNERAAATAYAETRLHEITQAVSPVDDAALADVQPSFTQADIARQSVRFDIDLDAGVDLAQVSSRSHRLQISGGGAQRRIELADAAVPTDRDFELSWRPAHRDEAATVLFRERTSAGDHLLLVFMPPQQAPSQPRPREVIFVIDTSGSMTGESIEQARAALRFGLSTLQPADRFNVIQFNSTHESLFEDVVEATPDQLWRAQRYVDGLRADGGTEMLPALAQALHSPSRDNRLRQIVFITDGAVANEDQLMSLIRRDLCDARLFTVGIGSAPNAYFMRKAAQMGRGAFVFIGSTRDVDERMRALFRKLAAPSLTHISLHWPQGVALDAAPLHVPDLYVGEPLVLTFRTAAPLTGVLGISGEGHDAWLRQIDVDAASVREGVATLWARRHIESLLDEQASGRDESLIRQAVLPLALEYQLVSRYTSLVAIDKTPARDLLQPGRSLRIDNTKPKGSAWDAAGVPTTATSAQLRIFAGLVCLVMALFLVTALAVTKRRT